MHSHLCEKCGKTFSSTRNSIRFCSDDCRGFSNRTTAEQYSRIDGNLSLYLNRLLYKNNNVDSKSRANLTRKQLMDIWQRQSGLCAMSNVPMTYRAKQGEKSPYNASIDRIISGGPYALNNIQLVCTVVNALMKDYSKEDVVRLCISVADKHRSHSRATYQTIGMKR